jgi:hypothetical protein
MDNIAKRCCRRRTSLKTHQYTVTQGSESKKKKTKEKKEKEKAKTKKALLSFWIV